MHPDVGLGAALRARGHDVRIITNAYFAETVATVGLRLVPWGAVEHYDTVTVTDALGDLLSSAQVTKACDELAQRIRMEQPLERTRDFLEQAGS